MPLYSKESLETLKNRIDLVETVSSYVPLKRAGAAYKGLCPFHDEKTPSFVIQKGDSHYHCFGCGAHGDAIQFIMSYVKLGFTDAVESLAEKFQVHLERVERSEEPSGPSRASLKDALEKAARFFHFYLLHTQEGRRVLPYLLNRGLSLDFIRHFRIGLAPSVSGYLQKVLHAQHVSDEIMEKAGLIAKKNRQGFRDCFLDRISFPVQDPAGAVIGFSCRKYKEETFGGKYVNTAETVLFKKSRILFGLNYCRRRIAKERQVIIVEGQIDALSLIYAGFNFTVAGQGTAFGEGHVQELKTLGVSRVYLALDSDEAGRLAAVKIGDLFQKEGIEVYVASLPPGKDPDSMIQEEGAEKFAELLTKSEEYLDYLIRYHCREYNISSPSAKNQLVQLVVKKIRSWKHSLVIHESLKKVARILQVPEHIIGLDQDYQPNLFIKRAARVDIEEIDPVRILECDFLRWLILHGKRVPAIVDIAKTNLSLDALRDPGCQRMYGVCLERLQSHLPLDLLSLLSQEEDQTLISQVMDKKVQCDKPLEQFIATVQKILDRNWMEEREALKRKIQSGQCDEEEAIALVKQFDELKARRPGVSGE